MVDALPWQHDASRQAYTRHLAATRVADRRIAAALRDAAREGERIIARTLGNPANVSQQVRRAQFQQSILALRESQAALWGEVTSATRAGIDRASLAATQGQMDLLNVLTRAVSEQGLGGPAQAQQLLDSFMSAARAAAEDVRSRVINNVNLSDQVWRTRSLSEGWVDRAVNRGIGLQKSAREIARDVRHLIRPDTPGGVSYAANRLARTEINNAFHTTEIRQGQELPWIEAFQWHLSGSHPVPDDCDDLADMDHDGLGEGIFRKDNVPFKPHPQCLCFLTTVTIRPEEFNQRLLNGDYDDWLGTQGFVGMRASA